MIILVLSKNGLWKGDDGVVHGMSVVEEVEVW